LAAEFMLIRRLKTFFTLFNRTFFRQKLTNQGSVKIPGFFGDGSPTEILFDPFSPVFAVP
jgi:hypothetical protein